MDVFGPEWADHARKLEVNWREAVAPDDLVLICGDISWAMDLDGALPDLQFVDSLPGVKYFIRGNHDYWHSPLSRLRKALPASLHLIRFDARVHNGVGICGVRGWRWPGQADYDPAADEKHWRRALLRLDMSLASLRSLQWDVAVAMFHFPPRDSSGASRLCDMIRGAGVTHCVYGHLHGADAACATDAVVDGVSFRCVSADRLGFRPSVVLESVR